MGVDACPAERPGRFSSPPRNNTSRSSRKRRMGTHMPAAVRARRLLLAAPTVQCPRPSTHEPAIPGRAGARTHTCVGSLLVQQRRPCGAGPNRRGRRQLAANGWVEHPSRMSCVARLRRAVLCRVGDLREGRFGRDVLRPGLHPGSSVPAAVPVLRSRSNRRRRRRVHAGDGADVPVHDEGRLLLERLRPRRERPRSGRPLRMRARRRLALQRVLQRRARLLLPLLLRHRSHVEPVLRGAMHQGR